jgi:hypothetical protein
MEMGMSIISILTFKLVKDYSFHILEGIRVRVMVINATYNLSQVTDKL